MHDIFNMPLPSNNVRYMFSPFTLASRELRRKCKVQPQNFTNIIPYSMYILVIPNLKYMGYKLKKT